MIFDMVAGSMQTSWSSLPRVSMVTVPHLMGRVVSWLMPISLVVDWAVILILIQMSHGPWQVLIFKVRGEFVASLKRCEGKK